MHSRVIENVKLRLLGLRYATEAMRNRFKTQVAADLPCELHNKIII